jgi:hypothetical protein
MENNQKENVVKTMLENGVVELTIRNGEALKELRDENVTISGAIDAPSRFIDKRNTEFNKLKSHTFVNRDEKSITTIINENLAYSRVVVVGKIKISKEFEDLGINSGKQYSPAQLSQKLKFMRSCFPNKIEHAQIVNTLRNIKATINKKMEDLKDERGNASKMFEQTVESNMPDSFEIEIPLIKGEEKIKFNLNVILEATGGSDISATLESIDAQEMIDEITERRIDEEVLKIQDFTTIIEC